MTDTRMYSKRRPIKESVTLAKLPPHELPEGVEVNESDQIRRRLFARETLTKRDFPDMNEGTLSQIVRELEACGFVFDKTRERRDSGPPGPYVYTLMNPEHEPTEDEYEKSKGIRSGHTARAGRGRMGRPGRKSSVKNKTKVTDSAYPKLPNVREQVMVTGVVLEENDQVVVILRNGDTTWKARLEGATA